MKNFIIPEQVLVNVINYLNSKPHGEVTKLITDIQTLARPEILEKEVKTEDTIKDKKVK